MHENEKNARHASQGSALDALDKAASRAEQAAQRLKASTALPFNQLDFELQHPEWSFAVHRSSSASNSRPASASGTTTSCPRSSISSASKSIPPSLIEGSAAQMRKSPSNSSGVISRPRGRPRKSTLKDLVHLGPDQGTQYATEGLQYLVEHDEYTAAGVHDGRHSFRDKAFHVSTHNARLSSTNKDKRHAFRSSSPSGATRVTDSKSFKQGQAKKTSQLAQSGPDPPSKDHPSSGPADQPWDKKLKLICHEVVDPVIQTMAVHYEGLYPSLDTSAICQEVLDETMETLLPDLIRERDYPNKRQKKVIRRFAKELGEKRILECRRGLVRSKRSSKGASIRPSEAETSATSFGFVSRDVSMLGAGESDIKPIRGRKKPLVVDEASQLESMGLSPEPENRRTVISTWEGKGRGINPVDEGFQRASGLLDHVQSVVGDKTSLGRPLIEYPSDQLVLTSPGDNPTALTQSINWTLPDSNVQDHQQTDPTPPDDIQESIECRAASGSETITPKRVVEAKPEDTLKDLNSHLANCSQHSFEASRSSTTKKSSTPNSSPNSEYHPIPTKQSTLSSPKMSHSNPIVLDSESDDTGCVPLPRPKVIRRATSGMKLTASKPKSRAPRITSATERDTQDRTAQPESIGPSTIFKKQHGAHHDPTVEQAYAALFLADKQQSKPYQSGRNLRATESDGLGAIKHVDFSDFEREEIVAIIENFRGSREIGSLALDDHLKSLVSDLSPADLHKIAHRTHETTKFLALREEKHIHHFLERLARGDNLNAPVLVRVEAAKYEPSTRISTETILRRRAYGHGSGGLLLAHRQLRDVTTNSITLQRSWKGASGDVISMSWHPNSQSYVIGATATSNPEDLQYNRPNNLLYGSPNNNTLHELPDHRIDRPKPETIANGPNASLAVYEACDPKVYKTVSAIQYSPEGTRLFTASHDRTVKVWDVHTDDVPICIQTLDRPARLTQLEVSPRIPHTFATGAHTIHGSIRVFTQASLDSPYQSLLLESEKAKAKPQYEISAECIRWGNTKLTEDWVLAGFARWGDLPDNNPGRDGELCIWDVRAQKNIRKTPCSQSVTTAAFHPLLNMFATGGAAGAKLTHRYTSKTAVRMYDIYQKGSVMELECPALDMQDLVFHPQNKDICAVGCSDGAVYVWDARKPDYVLHKLQHGQPIADWDHKYDVPPMNREQGDSGVTMTCWAAGKLYSGATDGVIKCWDINRAPEDALIKDVAQLQAGVSCGSFSPDHSSLLVGDSTGGVHLLGAGPGYMTNEERKFGMGPIQYIPAPGDDLPPPDDEVGQGQLAAQELLSSGQLTMHPVFGVGQGPAYEGPYATHAHEVGPPSRAPLLKEIEQMQPVSRHGHVRDNAAAHEIQATFARRRYELQQAREAAAAAAAATQAVKKKREGGGKKLDGDAGLGMSKKRKRKDSDKILSKILSRKRFKTELEKYETLEKQTVVPTDAFFAMTEEDMEDEHWFPHMDLDLFQKLNLADCD